MNDLTAMQRRILLDRDELFRRYVLDRKSTPVLGAELGVHAQTVAKYLERAGIPRRSAAEAARRPNLVSVHGEVATLALTDRRGAVVAHAVVDTADLDLITTRTWGHAHGYVASQCPTFVYLHRYLTDAPEDMVVDHRDGDRLNNRRSNLRLTDQFRNMQNRHSTGTGKTSVHRGVSFHKLAGKWRAYGSVNGRTVHLGLFEDEDVAAAAVAEWRRVHMPFSSRDQEAANVHAHA